MSFVKSQILNKLANSYPNFLKRDLEKALNLVFYEITEALSKGHGVEIRGFGTFKIRKMNARIGRNPKDGSMVNIPPKRSVNWKISKEFFKKLNNEKN